MTAFESWILSYFLNSLWQVPLLFAAGWGAARALRALGDAAEHRLWVAVLLLECTLPACPALQWERLWRLFGWGNSALRAGEPHVSVYLGASTSFGDFHSGAALLAAVALAYGAGTAYFAARFFWSWARLSVLCRDAREIALAGDAALFWAHCSSRFGVRGASIAASSRVFLPVTLGLSHKLVLLPAAMVSTLPESEMRTVIAHEFAHMCRNDFFKNLIYEAVSLPVSYHPLFRLTRRRIMESREIVCDRMAAAMESRSQYARSLLRLASLLVPGHSASHLQPSLFPGLLFSAFPLYPCLDA